MSFLDIIALALRNLRQAKLRTALTMIGVIVGVAAIITMVSFGIGLQNNLLRDALGRIDLFTQIYVRGPGADVMLAMRESGSEDDVDDAESEGNDGDGKSTASQKPSPTPTPIVTRTIDDAAIAELQTIKGVRYVVPNFSFGTYVQFEGRTRRAFIGGAPISIEFNPRFKTFLAGRHFSSDEAQEVVVTEQFISWVKKKPSQAFGRRRRPGGPFQQAPSKTDSERQEEAGELIGKEIVLLVIPGTVAAPSSIFGIPLLSPENSAGGNSREGLERRVYRIVGVLKTQDGFDFNSFFFSDMFIPLEQAKRFREANRDPMERMSEMLAGDTGYQSAEVRVTDLSQLESVENEIKKRGFNFWKFGNQIEDIKRVFLIVNASLALIGGIALLVASFGISNTMIMSIRERTREIGIMKAIGGSNGEIMRIFFVEASLIGLTGGVLGVISGWGIDRAANAWANRWIAQQVGRAVRHIEFFSIPWYLAAGAILFAVLVSLIAAIYPAFAAARVDPIKALRYE